MPIKKNAVKIQAKTNWPIPNERPMLILRNTINISLELPGMLLNLIKLKAPKTATLVPKLPLTIIITEHTINGNKEIVIRKFLEYFDVRLYVKEITNPSTKALSKHQIIDITLPSSTLFNIILFPPFLSYIYCHT